MSRPVPHDKVTELALQLLVAHHSLPSAEFTAGAQAVTEAKQAYTLAQVYLGTLDDLEPRGKLGGRP